MHWFPFMLSTWLLNGQPVLVKGGLRTALEIASLSSNRECSWMGPSFICTTLIRARTSTAPRTEAKGFTGIS